jgi:hypothetical protein
VNFVVENGNMERGVAQVVSLVNVET